MAADEREKGQALMKSKTLACLTVAFLLGSALTALAAYAWSSMGSASPVAFGQAVVGSEWPGGRTVEWVDEALGLLLVARGEDGTASISLHDRNGLKFVLVRKLADRDLEEVQLFGYQHVDSRLQVTSRYTDLDRDGRFDACRLLGESGASDQIRLSQGWVEVDELETDDWSAVAGDSTWRFDHEEGEWSEE